MKRGIRLYIDDVLESITRIEHDTSKLSEKQFEKDITVQDAVIRRLEIIGEAVKHIPQRLKAKYTKVPWKKIAGMRDVISHDYFGIKLERVWKTVKQDIPKLKEVILQAKTELKG